jgi:transketolase
MKATRDFFGDYLLTLAENNPKIVVVNCDLGEATRTLEFKKLYPDRYIEAGIAEANAISISAGLAKEGLLPFVTSFGHFLTGKFLEIFQSVGLNNANVTMVGTHAGLAIGKDGPTQMGLRDIALMRTLPNVRIYHPINSQQVVESLDEIIKVSGPKYLRLNRQPQEFFKLDNSLNFGHGDEIFKGEDLLVISQGAPTVEAYNAIKNLKYELKIGLLCISSLPVNSESYTSIISKYKKLLVIEDHFKIGGIADLVARLIADKNINIEFSTINVLDYGQSGDPKDLYSRYGLDQNSIENKLKKLLNE